jgi:hypothetical protein
MRSNTLFWLRLVWCVAQAVGLQGRYAHPSASNWMPGGLSHTNADQPIVALHAAL